MRACSTFASSLWSCSYERVVISVCDQVWDAIVCPLIISFLQTRVPGREEGVRDERRSWDEDRGRKDILWIQISNIIDMIIDTIVILALYISSPLDRWTRPKMEEGYGLTLRKKVPLPPLKPPMISRSKVYGPSIIGIHLHPEIQTTWDKRVE